MRIYIVISHKFIVGMRKFSYGEGSKNKDVKSIKKRDCDAKLERNLAGSLVFCFKNREP